MLTRERCAAAVGVALIPEPPGTVATRFAGFVDLRATLAWDDAPPRTPSCLPAEARFFRRNIGQTTSPCRTRTELSGTISALTGRNLGRALDLVLRSINDAAALTGAILEVSAILGSPPRPADPALAQALARDLWMAGLTVTFAPCWQDSGRAALAVGDGGEGRLPFPNGHHRWKLV